MIERTCKITGKPFTITDEDLAFYKKMGVITDDDMRGLPTLCPEERQRRRLAFVNISKLYKRKEGGTEKILISPFSPEKNLNVVSYSRWNSNNIDGRQYGKEFNFSKSFFSQFQELQKVAPRWDKITDNCENCDWGFNIANSKNCYLTIGSKDCENGYFSQKVYSSFLFSDCFFSDHISHGYEIIESTNISNSAYIQKGNQIDESFLLYDCKNCKYCFGCTNLRNKEYYVWNKRVSTEEFRTIKNSFITNTEFQKQCFEYFRLLKQKNTIHQNREIDLSENCTGNKIYSSKNTLHSFEIFTSEDIFNSDLSANLKSSMDVSQGDDEELSYETVSNYMLYNSWFIFNSENLINCLYCETNSRIKNCFGCIGLKNAEYCILNKQYTREEYEKLVPKIIEHMKNTGEWGEFFPMEMSPFGYNETVAQEYFPLEKPVGNSHGCSLPIKYNWAPEKQSAKYTGPKYEIPDDISDVSDEILDKILTCEVSGKHYRIIKPELEFYRKMNLPIPRLCPDERHKARMKLRNPRKLWKRNCDNCGVDIETTFAPERPEKVFCEKCYQEVVQ